MTDVGKFSLLSLVLLFPGAFFYHVAMGLGYIPPVLGGYISIVGATVLVPLVGYSFVKLLFKPTIKKSNLVFYIFIMSFGSIAAYHFLTDQHIQNSRTNFLLFINLLACYFIFKNINTTDKSFKKTLITLTLAMSALILYYSEEGRFAIDTLSEHPGIVANYQTFALAYFPFFTLTIAKTESKTGRYSLFVLGFICLYLNSARSEFVATLIFFTVFEATVSKQRILSSITTVFVAVIAIAMLLAFSADTWSNRTFRLVNLSEDNSSNVRDQIAREGFEKIMKSPIIGDYGNYEPGLYIHNILSAWQDLGLLGFIYFCMMLAVPLTLFACNALLHGDRSRDAALCLGMLTATTILLIYGKYFAYPLVAVSLGMVSSTYHWRTKEHSNMQTRMSEMHAENWPYREQRRSKEYRRYEAGQTQHP